MDEKHISILRGLNHMLLLNRVPCFILKCPGPSQEHGHCYINKINGTNFLAPDAHFDNTCLFSDARGQNI